MILQAPTPQNGQTHSNNSSVTADNLFECVWPFYGVGVESVLCSIYPFMLNDEKLRNIV